MAGKRKAGEEGSAGTWRLVPVITGKDALVFLDCEERTGSLLARLGTFGSGLCK